MPMRHRDEMPIASAPCRNYSNPRAVGAESSAPRIHWQPSRRRNSGNPGPSRLFSRTVRPLTVIIKAVAGPRISALLPQVRSTSVPYSDSPRSLPRGTKPNGHGPVRKSSASARQLRIGFKRQLQRNTDIATVHENVGERVKWPKQRRTQKVIGATA